MKFEELDFDILEQIYQHLSILDRLMLAQLFTNLRDSPTIFASIIAPTRSQDLIISEKKARNGFSFDWYIDKTRYENWISIDHLEQPLKSSILIDLVFCISCPQDINATKRVLDILNARNINSVSYEIEDSYDKFTQTMNPTWLNLTTFSHEPYPEKLQKLHIKNAQLKVFLPQILELKELIIENVQRIVRLPMKVGKLRIVNLIMDHAIVSLIPKGIWCLEIEFKDIPYFCFEKTFEVLWNIVAGNKRTLTYMTITDILPTSINTIMRHVMDSPELLEFRRYGIRREYIDYTTNDENLHWELQCSETHSRYKTNTWIRRLVANHPRAYEDSHERSIPQLIDPVDFFITGKYPQSLKKLRIEIGRGLKRHKLPLSLEELYVKAQGEFPCILEENSRLRVLELTGCNLELLKKFPERLTHIVGDIGDRVWYSTPSNLLSFFQKVPRLKSLGLRNLNTIICDWPLIKLQSLSIDSVGMFIMSNIPMSMSSLRLCYKTDTSIFHEISGKLAMHGLESYRFNLKAIANSNLKFLQLEIPKIIMKYIPIELPLALEVLILKTDFQEMLYLKFPENSKTNLRSVELPSEKTKYTFLTIGHGMHRTEHTQLQYIYAWNPPGKRSYYADNQFFDDLFCPPNLRQIRCRDRSYLNPKFYSEEQKDLYRSEYIVL